MEKLKVIMDVDTGTDDAVALIMALLCKDIDLLGICSVNGNVEVKLTTDNTLRVVECCGKEDSVTVYRGCEFPLVSTLLPWTPQSTGIMSAYMKEDIRSIPRREGTREGRMEIHGDHLPLPAPTIRESQKGAIAWLLETLLNAQDGEITLIPVGPLTNIAVAMRADPRIVPKIRQIVLMGGGHLINNRTPAAEFNFWADPEAAEIVMQSGCDITIVPLDATYTAYITEEQAAELRRIGTKPANFVADMIETRIAGYAKKEVEMRELAGAPIHDALAVCAVLHPEVLTDVLECNCHIDISVGYAYGQSIVDRRSLSDPEPVNCKFALQADRDLFFRWMKEVLEQAR